MFRGTHSRPLTLKKTAKNDKIPLRHPKGDDVHGQVYPQGETEQESSEGTQPSAACHLGKHELRIASDYYSALVDFITGKMNGLEEQDDEDLLTYHHLQHMPLNEISIKLHHSRTWGYRRHDIALKNLDTLLNDLTEADIPTKIC